jgi:myo-inositol-1(or 4)-monophosphatase
LGPKCQRTPHGRSVANGAGPEIRENAGLHAHCRGQSARTRRRRARGTRSRQGRDERLAVGRIIGEENAESGEGELVWYVDPIDGTTNFAHGHFFFGVSIALYRGSQGLAGVVHAPALDVTWKAAKGIGAFRNGKPCFVSTRDQLEEAVCATGFPYERWSNPDNNHAELALFLQRARGIRRCGAASVDLCLVADGTYDIYWEQALNAWDMCAGALLVQEAGGQLSTYEGEAVDPRTGKLIASNGLLHEAAVRTIREARNKLPPDKS